MRTVVFREYGGPGRSRALQADRCDDPLLITQVPLLLSVTTRNRAGLGVFMARRAGSGRAWSTMC